MDILPSGSIFRELQDIQDFGYFSSQSSIEDQWQQVNYNFKTLNWELSKRQFQHNSGKKRVLINPMNDLSI